MQFSKMHGLGNDFMIINAITQNVHLSPKIISNLSNRHTGIGFDQLLLIEPPYDPNIDFHYRIFNANGTEASQCGNGARCFAYFVHLNKLTNKKKIKASTKSGNILITINNNNDINVNMGEPNFNPKTIPFYAKKKEKRYIIKIKNRTIICGVVSIGNPHCVIQVKNLYAIEIKNIASKLEIHERFPNYTNVDFMEIINSSHIRLRVYERGVGETLACGTGACAAVAVGINQKLLKNNVQVDLTGGTLNINWNGYGSPLYMRGPAVHVYNGIINI
ncbi:diaminopimelate epimerase [Candidatus Providencia siddallii]|uniref:Diaminopimelate epimerase n=1 Tax=Candidatus Providencia siddallii TaxID=1715285 RepID=A0ABM9NNI0_9GAMM